MRWKAIVILLILIAALFPVYLINKYLQKIIKPRKSPGRLLFYLLTGMLLVFLCTLFLVLLIRWVFPKA
ncbi:MAG TPA: hypothetical protein VK588_15800 [Chitinophagaceae bacterium]|nr:hypothetical protein [Chitinophagaceae bacterium]